MDKIKIIREAKGKYNYFEYYFNKSYKELKKYISNNF